MSESSDQQRETYYAREARTSDDEALIQCLLTAMTCAYCIPQTDPSVLEAGIAELVCEVMRRGLDLPDAVEEPMVPEHALRRMLRAIQEDNARMAWDAIAFVDGQGLWVIFRRYQQLPGETPERWMEEIAFQLERRVVSNFEAWERVRVRRSWAMSPDDYTAMLEHTIGGLFSNMFTLMDTPRSDTP